jgi:hypothetical protein
MNDNRTDLEVFQQCRDLVFGDWTAPRAEHPNTQARARVDVMFGCSDVCHRMSRTVKAVCLPDCGRTSPLSRTTLTQQRFARHRRVRFELEAPISMSPCHELSLFSPRATGAAHRVMQSFPAE